MADRDYYEVLGVGRSADEGELKRAFRQLARRYHPDANRGDPDAAERFKEVGRAYAVLSDPEKRARYDQLGHQGFTAAESGGGGGAPGDAGFGGIDIQDLFESVLGEAFFGGGRRRAGAAVRGADLRAAVQISFEEAAFGCRREVTVPRIEACSACGGSGAAAGTRRRACQACGGSGQARVARTTPFGQFVSVQPCANCRGQGTVLERPCGDCRGEGRVRRQRTLTVDIPAGIESGQALRLSGAGQAGERGGPPGDLFVEVRVNPHATMRRDGRDVCSDVTIGFAQAALGGEVEVETLEGKVPLEIPAGTQPGAELRLRGRGVVAVHGHERGDHRVAVRIEVPRHLSGQERELLRRYAELRGERVAADRNPLRRVLGR